MARTMRRPKASTGKDARVATRTAREHETIVGALHALERALTAPAPGKERAWFRRSRRELAKVIGSLQDHCESAERDGGLLREAQLKLGSPALLSRVRRDHDELSRDTANLLGDMDDESLSYNHVRRRAVSLAARLRTHQAREADLLLETFERDIGGID